MKTYQVNQEGFYGDFGGAYIPEILHRCVEELRNAYRKVLADEGFQKEYDALLKDYVGRPSPLYLAPRLSEKYGCKIYLKREDLNHTGAHKINNAIGDMIQDGSWENAISDNTKGTNYTPDVRYNPPIPDEGEEA